MMTICVCQLTQGYFPLFKQSKSFDCLIKMLFEIIHALMILFDDYLYYM